MNNVQISLPYGEDKISFTIPKKNVGEVISPRNVVSVKDIDEEINRALDNPIESKRIEDMVSYRSRVLLIADDVTRKTPVDRIIPIIIQRLVKKGIRRKNIKILIALGTHRHLLDFGTTKNGTSIKVNKLVRWADFILGVGMIIPHHICGFSGGAKIVQPGICGAETTAQTHLLSAKYRRSFLGEIENMVREEMEEIALKVGMRHIFNVVLNRKGGLVKAYFGDYKQAFREGVRKSQEIYGVKFNHREDIVIASSYPCDIDFWQAHKTLYSADRVSREGGSIIVVTPCPEGVAQTHPELLAYAFLPWKEIERKIENEELTDYVGAALALAWAKIREDKRILLVSQGIKEEEAQKLGFIYKENIERALDDCFRYYGKTAKVNVLTSAPETLPLKDVSYV